MEDVIRRSELKDQNNKRAIRAAAQGCGLVNDNKGDPGHWSHIKSFLGTRLRLRMGRWLQGGCKGQAGGRF